MKIALINEFSQAAKNGIILDALKEVAEPLGHTVFNTGMVADGAVADDAPDQPADNPSISYVHIGVQAALLLNSGAVDFVITGCGTGQGALLSSNSFPGVVCGYCVEPSDAYMFLQINAGNALSIPFAKGFGWGAELNLKNIFQQVCASPIGMGYPPERRPQQNRNVGVLDDVKHRVAKPMVEVVRSLDPEMVRRACTPRFLECFLAECKDPELKAVVQQAIA